MQGFSSKRRGALHLFLSAGLFSLLLISFLAITHDAARRMIGIPVGPFTARRPSFPTFFSGDLVLNGSEWTKACSAARRRSHRVAAEGRWPPPAPEVEEEKEKGCDVFSGRWVYDEESYPLYDEAECPWMSDQLACRKHGRPDSDYQHWRWQPHGCDLKRWNATDMLEKLRGKRLMFVGDSLDRGQWISLICLLQPSIRKKSMSPNAALTTFKAEEYNASIEFYWAPLIVDSNSDDPVNHRLEDRIIRPDSLLKHTRHWEKADILIFNTYLWWRSGQKIKLLWSARDAACEEADGLEAMTLAMETWASWVASRVNHPTQRVFFVTMSPTHLLRREWNPGSEGNCYQETTPIAAGPEGYRGSSSDVGTASMVDGVLRSLGANVTVLNITQMSEYRKDGHPSVFRKFWEAISPERLSEPESYADCIHWCLPGVPDAWNELLFQFM